MKSELKLGIILDVYIHGLSLHNIPRPCFPQGIYHVVVKTIQSP